MNGDSTFPGSQAQAEKKNAEDLPCVVETRLDKAVLAVDEVEPSFDEADCTRSDLG
jgi:hypothetical protein